MYTSNSKMNKNEWITDPRIPDPANLPKPLGWTLLVRPYPVQSTTKGGIIMVGETIDFANYLTNVGRIVAIGPCAWNKREHYDKDGKQFDWAKIGDFVGYTSHVGLKRKFKGVSFVVLTDDDILEVLTDPVVYEGEDTSLRLDIPEEDLKRYNTIYNPHFDPSKEPKKVGK